MIITSENAKLMPKASNNIATGAGPQAGLADAPPSYQTTHRVPTQPYIIQHHVVQQPVFYRTTSPARRFWGAFAVAVLIWFLLTGLIQSMYGVTRWRHPNLQGTWEGDFPIPQDVVLSHCVTNNEWSKERGLYEPLPLEAAHPTLFPYSASTSFELPLSYDTLFLLSRGSQTHGTVNIVTSNEVSEVAKVYVTVKYYNRDVLDRGSMICLVERPRSKIGVGFFTRLWTGYDRRLYYEATVVLPSGGNRASPRHIKNFETDVPNTSHKLDDLQGFVQFSRINISSTNAPISVNSILVDEASFRTTNSPIIGVFNATRSLSLATTNSPIQVDVGVHNKNSYVSTLNMRTTNGKIEARISLTSAFDGGQYMATATTTNNPLTISFAASPVNSTLKLTAATNNSPASIALHPAYEGSFDLATTNVSPSVKRHEVDDPSGNGRKRIVQTTSLGRRGLSGKVSWTDQDGPGIVRLRSTNSPVVIEL